MLSGETVILPNGEQNLDEVMVVVLRVTRRRLVLALMVLDQPVEQLVPPPPQPPGPGADQLAEHAEASQRPSGENAKTIRAVPSASGLGCSSVWRCWNVLASQRCIMVPVSDAAAIMSPRGDHAQLRATVGSSLATPHNPKLARSHTLILESSPPETRYRLSGEKARDVTYFPE